MKDEIGRKKISAVQTTLDEVFAEVLKEHTAGDPMRGEVRWTDLGGQEIAQAIMN